MKVKGGAFPFSLLIGMASGVCASLIVALMRRRPPGRNQPTPNSTAEGDATILSAAAPDGGTGQTSTPGDLAPHTTAAVGSEYGSTRWPTATKYVVGVILLLALIAVAYFSRSVIPLVIFAALLALIVHPIVELFHKRLRLPRGLAVGLSYVLLIATLLVIPLVLIPSVVGAVNSFLSLNYQAWIGQVKQALQSLSTWAAGIPVLNSVLGPSLESIRNAFASLTKQGAPSQIAYSLTLADLGGFLAKAVGGLGKILGPVISAVTSVVFMALISIYLSLSADRIGAWYPRLLPPGYEGEIHSLFSRVGRIWTSFLRSQLVLMILIGTAVFLGNLALGNSNALLLGTISGSLELIPNIGPALALIPGVLTALVFGSSHFALSHWIFALIVVAMYLLVQLLENHLVVPLLMSDAVGLPPLVVIVGTFVGGATLGLPGVLLATPVIATGREVFMYLYNKILEPHVAQAPPAEHPHRRFRFGGSERNRFLKKHTGFPPADLKEQP